MAKSSRRKFLCLDCKVDTGKLDWTLAVTLSLCYDTGKIVSGIPQQARVLTGRDRENR